MGQGRSGQGGLGVVFVVVGALCIVFGVAIYLGSTSLYANTQVATANLSTSSVAVTLLVMGGIMLVAVGALMLKNLS